MASQFRRCVFADGAAAESWVRTRTHTRGQGRTPAACQEHGSGVAGRRDLDDRLALARVFYCQVHGTTWIASHGTTRRAWPVGSSSARSCGRVSVVGTEIVGLVPMRALIDSAEYYLGIEAFDPETQVLEYRLN